MLLLYFCYGFIKIHIKQINFIKKLSANKIDQTKKFLDENKIKKIDDCNVEQASNLISLLQKKENEDFPEWS